MEKNKLKRKQTPLYSGLIKYFPDALCEVARVSYIGSKQHHPEEEIHWDRDKSKDDLDALMRHLMENGMHDIDGVEEQVKQELSETPATEPIAHNPEVVEKFKVKFSQNRRETTLDKIMKKLSNN